MASHLAGNANHSAAIRNEITRFESVHPSIYAIYDLIEHVPEALQDRIREHVVCIEDSFVNSQEWTLSRSVPDLKLGVLGSVYSGKSALIHRYLTGSYMQDESPEGGRFKKEVVIDGQSFLLLIRDEGSAPDMQFSQWVDAVMFVFSLENETSFNTVYHYYAKMAHYRNTAEVPLILVGTQDAISESNPRIIDEGRARRLASDLKRCSYYETCATYGLNVERVLQDACHRIVQRKYPHLLAGPGLGCHSSGGGAGDSRPTSPQVSTGTTGSGGGGTGGGVAGPTPRSMYSLPPTPVSSAAVAGPPAPPPPPPATIGMPMPPLVGGFRDLPLYDQVCSESREPADASVLINTHAQAVPGYHNLAVARTRHSTSAAPVPPDAGGVQKGDRLEAYLAEALRAMPAVGSMAPMPLAPHSTVAVPPAVSVGQAIGGDYYHVLSARPPRDRTSFANTASSTTMSGVAAAQSESSKDGKDLPTPSSTPTQGRKQNRRKSNLFKKGEEEKKTNGIGSGRIIPLKQGTLYKKGSNPLSRDWKKKYVVVEENRLTIFTNLNDYMENVRGKEVDLSRATVKIPGQYRPGRGAITSNGLLKSHLNDLSNAANNAQQTPVGTTGAGGPSGTNTAASRRSGGGQPAGQEGAVIISNDSMAQAYLTDFIFKSGQESANTTLSKTKETPAAKKRHKRAKSGAKMGTGDGYDSDGYEFMIVNMDSKQWHFEAGSSEERDEWVSAIEQAILNSLQIRESYRTAAASGAASASRSGGLSGTVTADIVQTVRSIAGNDQCADCGAPDPGWASLNLGALLCIDCSGVHRQLGTHISRVRSLDLDDWPCEHVAVMRSIGNTLANSVWEAAVPLNAGNRRKPGPSSPREEVEAWIRAKYDRKEFLPPVPYPDAPIQQQLIDAIAREDTRQVVLCLAVANDAVNAPYSKQDPRAAIHIAATLGQMVYLQLLLWYNANVRVVDHEGRNAYFYAQASGKTECADFLKLNGCPEQGVPSLMSPAAYHQATAAVAATLPRRRRMGPNEIGL